MSRDRQAHASKKWLGRSLDMLRPGERRVIESAMERTTIATDVNQTFNAGSSFGDRLADTIARVGGSWSFIIGFFAFLAIWVLLNTVVLLTDAFDPYPFIFLNLVLSMLAAIQAPIIMMSQNRAATRDRLDASHDYEINLKAEIEILALHEKLDAMRQEDGLRVEVALAAIAERLGTIELHVAARRSEA